MFKRIFQICAKQPANDGEVPNLSWIENCRVSSETNICALIRHEHLVPLPDIHQQSQKFPMETETLSKFFFSPTFNQLQTSNCKFLNQDFQHVNQVI